MGFAKAHTTSTLAKYANMLDQDTGLQSPDSFLQVYVIHIVLWKWSGYRSPYSHQAPGLSENLNNFLLLVLDSPGRLHDLNRQSTRCI